MTALYVLLVLILVAMLFFAGKTVQLKKGRQQAEREISDMQIHKLQAPGAVSQLTILPLMEFHADDPALNTEPGISYQTIDKIRRPVKY